MTWGDYARDIVFVGVAVDCAVVEVSHLWWLLWNRQICDDVVEIGMVGECWHSDVINFYM